MASLLILSFLLIEAAAGLVSVKEVKEGGTVTLDCSDSRTPIRAVEWIKDDQPQKFILFYSAGHLDLHHQHSTFKDRVKLADLHHQGGDFSLLLKNVVLNDTGTYKCVVAAGDPRRRKRASIDGEMVRTIQLKVTAKDNTMNDNTMNDNTVNDNTVNVNTVNDNTLNDNTVNDNTLNDNTVNKPVSRSFVGLIASSVLLLVVVVGVLFGRVNKTHLAKRSDGAVNDQFIKHSSP